MNSRNFTFQGLVCLGVHILGIFSVVLLKQSRMSQDIELGDAPVAAVGLRCPQKDALPQCIANSQRAIRTDRCAAAVAEVTLTKVPQSRCYWRQCRNRRPFVSNQPYCRMHRSVRDSTGIAIFDYEPGASTCGFELVPLDRETPVSVPVYLFEDRLVQGLLTVADLRSQVRRIQADTKQLEQKIQALPENAPLPQAAQQDAQNVLLFQGELNEIDSLLRDVYPNDRRASPVKIQRLVNERNVLLDRLQQSVDNVTAAVSVVGRAS